MLGFSGRHSRGGSSPLGCLPVSDEASEEEILSGVWLGNVQVRCPCYQSLRNAKATVEVSSLSPAHAEPSGFPCICLVRYVPLEWGLIISPLVCGAWIEKEGFRMANQVSTKVDWLEVYKGRVMAMTLCGIKEELRDLEKVHGMQFIGPTKMCVLAWELIDRLKRAGG